MAPTSYTLHAYWVGFGDCFLLTFHYPKGDRHVLIDFGTAKQPPKTGAGYMHGIAKRIAADCGGNLHAIVASHRHRDHISGFATEAGGRGPGDIIRGLKPEVIVQPWTEDPRIGSKAATPSKGGVELKAFSAGLSRMGAVAESFIDEVRRIDPGGASRRLSRVGLLAAVQVANRSAVENLARMGKRRVFTYYGQRSGLESVLPGVRIRVLGPPSFRQSQEVRKQRGRDPSEFWHLCLSAATSLGASGGPVFARYRRVGRREASTDARWFIPRVRRARSEGLLELTNVLDAALNNTSLVLLFEVGKSKLLFPGDAQIENWSYVLFQAKDRKSQRTALAGTTLYKIGHHGSLNATPKTLWGLLKHRGRKGTPSRLVTVLSTMKGVHGSRVRGTEVPRERLLQALAKGSTTRSCSASTGAMPIQVMRGSC